MPMDTSGSMEPKIEQTVEETQTTANKAGEALDTELNEEQKHRLAELEADARAAQKAADTLAEPVSATQVAVAPVSIEATEARPSLETTHTAAPTQGAVQPMAAVQGAPVPPAAQTVPAAQQVPVASTQVYTAQQQQAQTRASQYVPQTSYVVPAETKPKVGGKAFGFGVLGGLLSAGALVGILLGTGALGSSQGSSSVSVLEPASTSAQAITITPTDEVSVAQVVAAKALPSVVSVSCTLANGTAMGSGVILDTQGNIITNYHVVEDATAISVTIEGRSYEASVLGSDPSSDLAVIHADLEGASVTPIEQGDSSQLKVGDWVMTVGSPLGLDQSVSAGIVSSLYRNETMTSEAGTTIYANLIQVDASINHGNSGGALVNSQGQLVGISTLFSSYTDSFSGIGFAIPSNYAMDIANKIIAGEAVTHAYIGLGMTTVNAQNAQANGLAVNQGAYVAEVYEGSPADVAGIQTGDIVVKLGDDEIASADAVMIAVRTHAIGETVQVVVVRGEEELSFDVTLGSDEELQARQRKEREETQEDNQTTLPDIFGNPDDNSWNGLTEDEWNQLQEWYDKIFNQNGGR